jgi:hypothetical protein
MLAAWYFSEIYIVCYMIWMFEDLAKTLENYEPSC